MIVKFNDLGSQWQIIKENTLCELNSLFTRSDFILGSAVTEFEKSFAEYVGCKYAVGVSNGTDALKLAAASLNLQGNTCVLIPANTFIATIFGVEYAIPDATFVLLDCDEHYQLDCSKLERFLQQDREKYDNVLIVPVHLYGYSCDMTRICKLAQKYKCQILEDASQAHGTRWQNKMVGSFGDVAAFSLYPGKNLGAAGDAGIVTTNNKDSYERLLHLRNLGSTRKYYHVIKGHNHRLDTIQAIVLKNKLPHLDAWNEARRGVVKKYEEKINNLKVKLPKTPDGCLPTHHVYPVLVENREAFIDYMNEINIQTGVHYPICIEEMPMYKNLLIPNKMALEFAKKMVSLPIHPFMSDEDVETIIRAINEY